MKGDKVVEVTEILANSILFLQAGQSKQRSTRFRNKKNER